MGILRRRERNPEPDFWEWLARHPDAYGALVSLKGHPDMRYRLQVGSGPDGGWLHTDPNTHVLVIGPSQSAAGKTAGVIIPTVLMQGGPVVTTSTKIDVARNTGLARSRLGDVWHYDPTGAPPPPGFKELRWSPVGEARDWNGALEISRQMVAASNPQGQAQGVASSENAHHFKERAGDLLAALLHYAALTTLDMPFVVDRISAYNLKEELGPIYEDLRQRGAEQAARLLRGILMTEPREQSGIFSTATVALRGYQGTARRAATDVNFDPVAFVAGQPNEPSDLHIEPYNDMGNVLANAGLYPRLTGRYDTVYITTPNDKQSLYAPLVVGLLSAIKRATYAQNRADQLADMGGRRQPVTFVLDEMYGAPLPDLPELLSEGGGQGLLMVGALQDLSQAVARWGTVGEGFLTLWQNVIVMPGIRHRGTLELLSLLVGDYDRVVSSQGQSQALAPGPLGFQRRIWMLSESESIQRERILPPDAIYRGNPAKKREVLIFTPNGGWQHVDLMRYWAYMPWPVILTQSSEWALNSGKPQNWALPLPEFDRGGSLQYLFDAGGQELVDWFNQIKALWRQKQAEIPKETPTALPPPAKSDDDDIV